MQSGVNGQGMFAQFHQRGPANAPTAVMVGPNRYCPLPDEPVQEQTVTMATTSTGEKTNDTTSTLARTLPSPDIDSSSIDDAYVQFIFYCNPSIPLSTDAGDLRRGFRSMPKTDGNQFDTFTLFGLIKKLEAKEIETWSQLVTELGVEPPDVAKNQSTQKVQQFAVRLKVSASRLLRTKRGSPFRVLFQPVPLLTSSTQRWLHAYHIDAFFQYCLGKTNPYWTEVPAATIPLSDVVRDGVPAEEDLALRALLPAWRPKRGRRKAEYGEGDSGTPAKRVQRHSSLSLEDPTATQESFSAYPQSAFPWSQQPPATDVWTAAQRALTPHPGQDQNSKQPSSSQQTFWIDMPGQTPSTTYPQSAVTPRQNPSPYQFVDTPQSAHPMTASGTSHPKKRHGPAVSAAWSTPGKSSSGKLPRGRPPGNRSIQDGPFSTFPANPESNNTSARSVSTPIQPTTPGLETSKSDGPANGLPTTNTPTPAIIGHTPTRKPSKLSLQVPQHSGGPVRLATPPPKVLVNGEAGEGGAERSHGHERRTSADFFNSVDAEFSEADDDGTEGDDKVDWKRRALVLQRKLLEKEAELKAVRKRVLEAVM